nr:hypothetical protein [uncultured bacterium]
MISRFIAEEEGQTLVEYGLLISLIALAIVTTITLFGKKVNNYYNNVNNQLPTN